MCWNAPKRILHYLFGAKTPGIAIDSVLPKDVTRADKLLALSVHGQSDRAENVPSKKSIDGYTVLFTVISLLGDYFKQIIAASSPVA